MADALDSKSSGLRAVRVQIPPPVLQESTFIEAQRTYVVGQIANLPKNHADNLLYMWLIAAY